MDRLFEPVVSTGGNESIASTLIEFHLSETSGSYHVRTWTDLVADRDATDCAISPPQHLYRVNVYVKVFTMYPKSYLHNFALCTFQGQI